MRSFYHFLGTGVREDPTWYRSLATKQLPDRNTVNDVIVVQSHTKVQHHTGNHKHDVEVPEVNVPYMQYTENNVSIDELRESFQNSIENFTELVNARISSDPLNYSKAVKAFNDQCSKILEGSSDAMIQKALHSFGKETCSAAISGKKKNSGEITVQSKSKSRRKYKMRGSKSTLKGRPTKDLPRSSKVIDGVVWYMGKKGIHSLLLYKI